MRRTIYMLFVGVGLFLAGALYEYTQHKCYIPEPQLLSMTETQRLLVELGYDLKIDGKIGPQTLAAWDHAFCEQSAKRYFSEEDEQ